MNREEMRLAAEEMDALKDSGHEFDGLVRVNAKVAKNPRDVLVFEIDSHEFLEVVRAARDAGQEIDQFIRDAVLARAREGISASPASRRKPASRGQTPAVRKASA